MIKIRKRYRIVLSVYEVIEEPGKLDTFVNVTAAETEMQVHTIEILKGAGNGHYVRDTLKTAIGMLHHHVERPVVSDSERI